MHWVYHALLIAPVHFAHFCLRDTEEQHQSLLDVARAGQQLFFETTLVDAERATMPVLDWSKQQWQENDRTRPDDFWLVSWQHTAIEDVQELIDEMTQGTEMTEQIDIGRVGHILGQELLTTEAIAEGLEYWCSTLIK